MAAEKPTPTASTDCKYARKLLSTFESPQIGGIIDINVPKTIDMKQLQGYRGTLTVFDSADYN